MKTAISVPDEIFHDAEALAEQMGLARSQLYTRALAEFIDNHNKDKITEKLNTLYTVEDNHAEVAEAGLQALRKATENDSW